MPPVRSPQALRQPSGPGAVAHRAQAARGTGPTGRSAGRTRARSRSRRRHRPGRHPCVGAVGRVAAADLAAALADAAAALAGGGEPAPEPAREPSAGAHRTTEQPGDKRSKGKGKGAKGAGAKAKGGSRRHPALPPGVFDGTPEAHRHLIATGTNLVVVDGYNVSRAAWSGLAPEEERRRTVALLDDLQARSGGKVIVVFDGDDAVTAPKSSKHVRVRFSATGQTADDAIDRAARRHPGRPGGRRGVVGPRGRRRCPPARRRRHRGPGVPGRRAAADASLSYLLGMMWPHPHWRS